MMEYDNPRTDCEQTSEHVDLSTHAPYIIGVHALLGNLKQWYDNLKCVTTFALETNNNELLTHIRAFEEFSQGFYQSLYETGTEINMIVDALDKKSRSKEGEDEVETK